uniref:Uncharacterized protein n=1 Tax=Panthera leo TaxID=9689 RepID=A0A8C8WHF5_PANLE
VQTFFCPLLSFPLTGRPPQAGPLLRPASLVPHGAGPRAPVVFVWCAHPIAKCSREASPPSALRELCYRQENTTAANWIRANVIPNCHVHTMCSAHFSVYESQVL